MNAFILATVTDNIDKQTNLISVNVSSENSLIDDLEFLYKNKYINLISFTVLLILPKEVAEEIIQEVFVSTLKRIKTDRSFRIENTEAYIKSAIALKAKNYHRKNFLRVVKDNQVKSDFEIFSTESDSDKESNKFDIVNKIIDALPNSQKTCVVLKYYEDMKISEIAKFLELSEGTVKSHLFRAVQTIKSKFEFQDEDI